jgi:predicted short-subunit dehydrogenase-like oxidoreductase (DUF2520 family)
MGQGLGLALVVSGAEVRILGRRRREMAGGLRLVTRDWRPVLGETDLVLVATRDDAIPNAAKDLADLAVLTGRHTVLHLSGRLGRSALAALERTGASLGSLHPLQTIADPLTAPARLRGVFAAVEGDDRAREAATALCGRLGMRPVEVDEAGKTAYHAGAAVLANYTVMLADLASRLAEQAGVTPDVAHVMYLPLLSGVLQNLESMPPQDALTGPIRRGDAETVRAHLAGLDEAERELYVVLGRATLRLAVRGGLEREAALAVGEVLGVEEV